MDGFEKLESSVRAASEELKKLDNKKPVHIISHLDCDGIASCAIIVKALGFLGLHYSVTIVKQLTKGILYDLSREKNETYIFLDTGSGELDLINELLKEKKVFVFDHHKISGEPRGIVFVNPEQFEISGSRDISGSGVAYLIYKEATKQKKMAHIAVVGAIGDFQEYYGFSEINRKILDDAKKEGLIKVVEGLRIPCSASAPVHKALEYCVEPFIPGVSGSESGALKFLEDINVNAKLGYKWKKISDLTEKEAKAVASCIIEKRLGKDKPEQIFGAVYILAREKKDSPAKNAAEYSNLLDACGRMEKASLGLGACLGDEASKLRAISVLNRYKQELIAALQWFDKSRKNKDSASVIEGQGYVIINSKYKIKETIIGAVAKILTTNPEYKEGYLILALARADDGMTKVSFRVAGNAPVDLKRILQLIIAPVKGHCGGHKYAAGGKFEKDKEEEFIENAKRVIEKFSVEEGVN